MLHRTEAIVLKTVPFSEADLIVTFLSLDWGVLKTFAKSPRKVTSRFGSSLEPLTYSKISFWGKEDADLPRLTQSDIIKPFQSIRERFESFLRVTELIELTLNLLPEREPNGEVFRLLRGTLDTIDGDLGGASERQGNLLERLAVCYKVKLLDLMGYGPSLDGGARCSRAG